MDQIVDACKQLSLNINDKFVASHFDECDPLKEYRSKFIIPQVPDNQSADTKKDAIYMVGNSLGLQPKSTRSFIDKELKKWEDYGVEANFIKDKPWYPYDDECTAQMAEVVGAKPIEIAVMNSLTANLHFLLTSFYTPTLKRFKILMEDGAFPSDAIAVRSHIKFHNLTNDGALILVKPRDGEYLIREEDLFSLIKEHGEEIALIFLGGVNYFTGQVFDMDKITKLGHSFGCMVGFDLAHGAGNLKLKLNEWGPDFAVWCTYKYLNSGPGGIGSCFIHERHAYDTSRPRFAGWWSHDRQTRFLMKPELIATPGASGYQVSNPPILCMATLKASLDIFTEVGMDALTTKSKKLTSYMQLLIEKMDTQKKITIITPSDESERGCQLSLIFSSTFAKLILEALLEEGVFCDFREPNCIRVAPCPLYNTFAEVFDFVSLLINLLNKF